MATHARPHLRCQFLAPRWRRRRRGRRTVGIVGSGPLTGPATLLEVHESGWVAPASPSKAIAAVPDFARSAVTFVIDLAAKPAATMSDIPVTSARLADIRHT